MKKIMILSLLFAFTSLAQSEPGLQMQIPPWEKAKITPVGNVFRVEGKSTRMDLNSRKAKLVAIGQKVFQESSFLTTNKAILSLKLDGNTYLRLGKDSKVMVTLELDQKKWVIYLYNGTAKINFKPNKKIERVIMRSAYAELEGTDGKYMLTFNPILCITSAVSQRGKLKFYNRQHPEENEVLEDGEYSYVDKLMDGPADEEMLEGKRLTDFLTSFKLTKEDLKEDEGMEE